MKTPFIHRAVLLVLLIGIVMPASGMPPRGTTITGIIQKVDCKAGEVQMSRDNKGTMKSFVLVKRTSFIANGKFIDACSLNQGTRIEVRYHVPFFGKPFATRVTLLSNAAPYNNTK